MLLHVRHRPAPGDQYEPAEQLKHEPCESHLVEQLEEEQQKPPLHDDAQTAFAVPHVLPGPSFVVHTAVLVLQNVWPLHCSYRS